MRVKPADSDEVLVMAAARVEHVLGEGAEILAHFPGEALAGTRYEPPFSYIDDFGPRGHTVLLGDFVTTEDGTGLVHTAIAFGEDDFRLGEQYGLTLQNPVREDGTFDERVTDYEGRSVKDADPEIVEALRESGRLLRAETYEHAYPHCWRCETPLIYYAKSSWYVRTTDVRDRMLAENEAITWQPEHIRDGRFGKWLANNQDWALSRERYWGTPLPIWQCAAPDCDSSFCAGAVSDLRERGGEVPEDLHRPYIDDVVLECERCGGEMRRVADTIDAWFDSGSMPFAQFHYPFENRELFEERFPAAFISEGIDQTRGWFYSLLAASTLLFDRTSYEACVCLGLILDPEGPEDVEEPRQRRRPLVGHRKPRRRRVPLVLLHRPAAVGGLPLLDRDPRARRSRASSRRSGTPTRSGSCTRTRRGSGRPMRSSRLRPARAPSSIAGCSPRSSASAPR